MNGSFQIKAYLIRNLQSIQPKFVFVNDQNYILIRKRLELERRKSIQILTDLKENGQIAAISKPRNRSIQEELDKIMKAKKDINSAILKIKEFYYK